MTGFRYLRKTSLTGSKMARAYRRHKDIPDHLQAVPLRHTARQGDLEQEVALQDFTHAIESHLQFPVTQQSGLDLRQGLLVLLTKETIQTVIRCT